MILLILLLAGVQQRKWMFPEITHVLKRGREQAGKMEPIIQASSKQEHFRRILE